MKILIAITLVLAAACGGRGSTPNESPGASAPASPASVWNTTGGPASPGVPATGPVQIADAGHD
jgi:hypothetical protein